MISPKSLFRACLKAPPEIHSLRFGVPPLGGSPTVPPKGGTPNTVFTHALKSWPGLLASLLLFFSADAARAAENEKPTNQVSKTAAPNSLMAALPPAKWQQVEKSVDRALTWIASQQSADGSFPTLPAGQPAVTSFCVMAFLSRGHQPGIGPYGQR